MIYNGKQASYEIQSILKEHIASLSQKPKLAIISIPIHPSIISFITIKRRFAEAIGVILNEYSYLETSTEGEIIEKIVSLSQDNELSGIIVQLPLPKHFDTQKILNSIPLRLDVDILSDVAWDSFQKKGDCTPPVAGAIEHILRETKTEIKNKKVVIVGHGKLVGLPVSIWFKQCGVTPFIIDISTDKETKLKHYKEADIVISGIGIPHHLKPEYFKKDVVLIDAGTSEQSGSLAGDFDPLCSEISSVFTPVPGGVGPLTVACLFQNLLKIKDPRSKLTRY